MENKNINKILNIIVCVMVVVVSVFYAGYYAYQDYLLEQTHNAGAQAPEINPGVEEH